MFSLPPPPLFHPDPEGRAKGPAVIPTGTGDAQPRGKEAVLAVCSLCGKETAGAFSCIRSEIRIGEESYEPVPYESAGRSRCPGCNVAPGGFHHVGCGMEICPKCRHRWIQCRCNGTKRRPGPEKPCRVIPFPRC